MVPRNDDFVSEKIFSDATPLWKYAITYSVKVMLKFVNLLKGFCVNIFFRLKRGREYLPQIHSLLYLST